MPHHKSLTPAGFVPPTRIVTDQFVLRPLKYADAELDYDTWSTSIDHLRGVFGPHSTWPRPEMTLEDNAIDLAWHQREHETKSSFAYTVLDPTEAACVGCVYVNPARKVGYEAEVYYWVRASEAGLVEPLGRYVHRWVDEEWPFTSVVYPGRDTLWEEYLKLADKAYW